MNRFKRHPILYSLLLLAIIIIILYITGILGILGEMKIVEMLFLIFLFGIFILLPFLLTIINIITLIWKPENKVLIKTGRIFEYITIVLGFLYSGMVLNFFDIHFKSDWWEVLYNAQVHTPIWTRSYPTVICLSCIGVMGYVALCTISIEKMPPLVIVSAIAAMYIGILECVLWIIQIFSTSYLILCLFPFNCIIIAAKTIRYTVLEWNEKKHTKTKLFKNKYLGFLNEKIIHAEY